MINKEKSKSKYYNSHRQVMSRCDKVEKGLDLSKAYQVHDGMKYHKVSLTDSMYKILLSLNLKWGDLVKTRKTGIKVKKVGGNKWGKK